MLRERNQRPVTFEEGKAMAKKLGAYTYMECSAITQENLAETMEAAINAALVPTEKTPRKGWYSRFNIFKWGKKK